MTEETRDKFHPEAIKKRLQIISREFRKSSPRENYEGELFNYCVALLNRLELTNIQKQIYFNKLRELELFDVTQGIKPCIDIKIDESKLSPRLAPFLIEWLDQHSGAAVPIGILSLKPGIGFIVKVDELDVPEEIFPDEFHQIAAAYTIVLEKLRNRKSSKPCRLFLPPTENGSSGPPG
jgi:hypothetical protein